MNDARVCVFAICLLSYQYPNGIGVENINGTKSMSPTNLQSHSYNLEELKQPLSININPLGRSEEEAVLIEF